MARAPETRVFYLAGVLTLAAAAAVAGWRGSEAGLGVMVEGC